jgi:hypothetical protein
MGVGHDCGMRRHLGWVSVIALALAVVELVRWANRAYVASMFQRGGDLTYGAQISEKAREALEPGLFWLAVAVACYFVARRRGERRVAHEGC